MTAAEGSELFDHDGVAHHRALGVEEMPTGIAAVDREHVDREHVDRSDDPRDAPRLVRLPRPEGTDRPYAGLERRHPGNDDTPGKEPT